jgi:hypothetical protein
MFFFLREKLEKEKYEILFTFCGIPCQTTDKYFTIGKR